MPFSRSRSLESMTRSTTTWLARKAPAWRSIASTSVVLPWSTWATMATLRTSARIAVAASTERTWPGCSNSKGVAERGESLMGARIVAHPERAASATGNGSRRPARPALHSAQEAQ